MGRRKREKGVWTVVGAAVLGAGLLIALSLLSVGGGKGNAATTDTQLGAVRNVWGDDAAPVKLVEYGDYTCVHCEAAWETLEPELESLIRAGKVQFTFEHFWLGGQQGLTAAVAAECAADQDEFWAYHNQLFSNQTGGFTEEKIQRIAQDLDLEMDEFNNCVESGTHGEEIVEQTQAAAQEKGIRGTPTFYLNGEEIKINQSFTEVLDAVKKELGQ